MSPSREGPQEATDPVREEAGYASRLRAALEGIGEAILVCDDQGRTVFQNEFAERLLSPRPSEALIAQAVSEMVREALAGGRPEKRLDLIAPTRRCLSIRAFPTGEDAPDGAVVVVEDISERLRLEAVRRDFVANVSHELKTPTGALILLAETLEGERDPGVISRLVRRMGSEAERLNRIIDDLLDLSRIESNDGPERAVVGLGDVIGEAISGVQGLADGLEVTIEVDRLPGGVGVEGDRRDLVSAVQNLVENAIKYSDPGGRVHVGAELSATEVAISVADHGVGIPARDMERIFERFYRVDRARSRSTGGTGLGLSIVRHVAANHGGTVRVSSIEGEGSTFVLKLPAVRAGAAAIRRLDPREEHDADSD